MQYLEKRWTRYVNSYKIQNWKAWALFLYVANDASAFPPKFPKSNQHLENSRCVMWLIMLLRKPFRNRIHLTQLHLQVNSWLDDGLRPARRSDESLSLVIDRLLLNGALVIPESSRLLNFVVLFIFHWPHVTVSLYGIPLHFPLSHVHLFWLNHSDGLLLWGLKGCLKTKDRNDHGHPDTLIVSSIFLKRGIHDSTDLAGFHAFVGMHYSRGTIRFNCCMRPFGTIFGSEVTNEGAIQESSHFPIRSGSYSNYGGLFWATLHTNGEKGPMSRTPDKTNCLLDCVRAHYCRVDEFIQTHCACASIKTRKIKFLL